MRRIALFIATNLAVLLAAEHRLPPVRHRPDGRRPRLRRHGRPAGPTPPCSAWAARSSRWRCPRWIAKWSTGARVIEQPQNETERWLVDTVRRHAQNAGIGMPEVAIYDAPEMNAFATGMTKNSALVAVSTGLLQQMDREQVERRARPRDRPRRQRRHGHADPDPGRAEHVRDLPGAHRRPRWSTAGCAATATIASGGGIGYFVVGDGAADGVRPVRLDDRVLVLALARVPRRHAAGAQFAGRGAMISALQRLQAQPRRKHVAGHDRRVRHLRSAGRRLQAPVHEPSAAGGAHRRAAERDARQQPKLSRRHSGFHDDGSNDSTSTQ